MEKIVRYQNDMNKIKLSNLTVKEQDLFFSILYKAQRESSNKIIITFSELKELVNEHKNIDRLISNAINLSEKLAKITQKLILPTGDIMIFSIFRNFIISPERNVLEVNIGEEFEYIIKDLFGGTYTQFELRHLVELKSSYSKTLFRLLKQWSSTGEYYVTLDEFRDLLDVPKTYDTNNFNKRVLKPILEELPQYFPNLKVEKIKKGKKIDRLKFKWNTKPIEIIEKDNNSLLEEKIYQEKEIVEKIISLKNAIPALEEDDIKVLVETADIPVILEKYYTLAIGKEIDNLTGFLMAAIKNDWKKTPSKAVEKKAVDGEMDELERRLQKRLFDKLNERKKDL